VNNSPVPAAGQERAGALARLARWCYARRRIVLVAWLITAAALIGTAQSFGSRFSDNYASGALPSQQAQNLLSARFPAEADATVDVVLHAPDPLTSGQNPDIIARLVPALRSVPHVSAVSSPLAQGDQRQLSADRRTGFVIVRFDTSDALVPASAVRDVIHVALSFSRPGLQVAVGGRPADNVVTAAPGASEGIGLTAAVLIMLLAFGSVVAMGLPILIALVGVGMGFGIVDAASHALTIPTFGPDLMAMIGLGVGIDYALLIVTRYRQELSGGLAPREATRAAVSTAGRSVLFAGGTVVIALLGLLVINLPFMDGRRAGGAGRGDPAARPARLRRPRHRRAAHTRPVTSSDHPHWSRVLVPVEPGRSAPPLGLRGRRAGGACRSRDPAVLHAPGLQRCGQRSALTHHPAGLRPAVRRIRPWLQRPSAHRGHATRAGREQHSQGARYPPSHRARRDIGDPPHPERRG
jgi:hypothetical protein